MNRRIYLITAVAIAVSTSGYVLFGRAHGYVPGEALFRLDGIVCLILVLSWIAADPALPNVHRPSFDHGMLMWMSFPLLAAYHMYLAHRWRGVLIVLGLLGLIALPDVVFGIAKLAVGR